MTADGGIGPTGLLLRAVREHPSSTAAQLADRAGIPRASVHGLLVKLEKRGTIYRWKRPGTRAWLWQESA